MRLLPIPISQHLQRGALSNAVTRYQSVHHEFSALVDYGVGLIEAQAGYMPASDRHYFAERIFGKLICHGLTLRHLSPPVAGGSANQLWDISSVYAIGRTLIETYEALAYVALEATSEEEHTFRILLWKLHAEERRSEMLRLIGSSHPEVPTVSANVSSFRLELLSHPWLASAGREVERKIQRGDTPPYHLSRAERDRRANIDNEYHTAVSMHLSSHVHTHPFSVYQLFEFQAGDAECLRLMSIPLQYSCGFLAKAIMGMRELFSSSAPPVSPELEASVARWEHVLRIGVKHVG